MLKPGAFAHIEVVDETPVAKPLRLKIPSQSERVMEYVRYEQFRAQQSREVETFEEADDFDLDNDEEWFSPYEEVFEAAPEPIDRQDPEPPAPIADPPAPVES